MNHFTEVLIWNTRLSSNVIKFQSATERLKVAKSPEEIDAALRAADEAVFTWRLERLCPTSIT